MGTCPLREKTVTEKHRSWGGGGGGGVGLRTQARKMICLEILKEEGQGPHRAVEPLMMMMMNTVMKIYATLWRIWRKDTRNICIHSPFTHSNLPRCQSQSQSHIMTKFQSGVRSPSGSRDQFFFLLEIFFRQLRVWYFVAPSLTRGRSVIYCCCWSSPRCECTRFQQYGC
jgi:hypothetical protein